MRVIVIGATGIVGNAVVPLLLDRGYETIAIGRNQLLLEHLRASTGCDVLERDVRDAVHLPTADWLIDLTFPRRRHPSAVIAAAREGVDACAAWANKAPSRRVLHTGTFVVAGYRRAAPIGRLVTKRSWDDGYVLAKSAAEREIHRLRCEQVTVLRLGNVVTDSSIWGRLLLRAASFGLVNGMENLDRAANLSSPIEVVDALDGYETLAVAGRIAGFTWRDAISMLGATCGYPTPLAGQVSDGPSPSPSTVKRQIRAAALAAATVLPGRVEELDKWRGWRSRRVVLRLEKILASDIITPDFPPRLPAQPAIAGGGRDTTVFDSVVSRLARAFSEAGYGLSSGFQTNT